MKKLTMLTGVVVSLTVLLYACSPIRGLTNADKKGFTGTWTLNNISFSGIPANTKIKTTIFNDVSADCFNGSQWALPGNGNGSYTISSSSTECYPGARSIVWSVVQDANKVKYVQFKQVGDGIKAKTVTEGYKLEVVDLTENSMTLRSPSTFEGKSIYILYNFVK